MKSYTLTLSASLILFAIFAVLWIMGLLNQGDTVNALGKGLGVILVVGLLSSALLRLMAGRSASTPSTPASSQPEKINRGPQF